MMKYKVGDVVKVKANTSGHQFKQRETVTIELLFPDTNPPHYKATNDEQSWFLTDVELLKPRKQKLYVLVNHTG